MRRLVLAVVAVAILLSCGCDTGPPLTAGYAREPTVLSGWTNVGYVYIRERSPGIAEGKIVGDTVRIVARNGVIRGNNAGVAISGRYSGGNFKGQGQYGAYQFTAKAGRISGGNPMGTIDLTFHGNLISGTIAVAKTTLYVGRGFQSLSNLTLDAALVAVLADGCFRC